MASNGVAEVDIGLTDSFSVRAGFRFMNSYYNPGSPKFRQNISFFGPQVGLALKF